MNSKEVSPSIPSTSSATHHGSENSGSKKNFHRKSSHYMRLPTPPPDPTITNPGEDSFDNMYRQLRMPENLDKLRMEKEHEFLEYLNSLPCPTGASKLELLRGNSIFAPAMAAEDAFDHLDKLYKILEQLLNLREQNSRLQRRVRALEHMKNIEEMHSMINKAMMSGENPELPEVDADTLFAENLLDNILMESKGKRSSKGRKQQYAPQKFRSSLLRYQRNRSSSMATDLEDGVFQDGGGKAKLSRRRASLEAAGSVGARGGSAVKSKVSKWTKVKAAFKWEKASPTVSGAKSQDSGLGGMLPVNNEVACYLRVPSTSDSPLGVSPADSIFSSYAAGVSTSGTLSSASSVDDLKCDREIVGIQRSEQSQSPSSLQHSSKLTEHHHGIGVLDEECSHQGLKKLVHNEASFSSMDENIAGGYLMDLQGESLSGKASPSSNATSSNKSAYKTPWSKVKEIIQTRKESLKKKQHRLSSKSDDLRVEEGSIGSDPDDVFEEEAPPKTPTLTLTVPTPFGLSEDDLGGRCQTTTIPLGPSSSTNFIFPTQPYKVLSHSSEMKKYTTSTTKTSNNSSVSSYEQQACCVSDDATHHHQKSQKSSATSTGSPCAQRRVSKWTKVKQAFLTSPSVSRTDDSNCTSGAANSKHFNNNVNDLHQLKLHDEGSAKDIHDEIYRNYQQLQNKLSIEFNEKLMEWERMKSNSPNSLCQSSTATTSTCTEAIDPKDSKFIKKMEEWERIKSRGNSPTCKQRQIPMTCEENLAPEFKKKLQEWQKLKKMGPKSTQGAGTAAGIGSGGSGGSQKAKKITDWQLWKGGSAHTSSSNSQEHNKFQMSDDFKKKLEEWKHMKATGNISALSSTEEQDKRRSFKEKKSPDMTRKESGNKFRQSKKVKSEEDRELHWLEKELQKIDREKQRLEKEREKFFEREEKLAKLRRSIMGGPHHKKEVLVQTPCGFYRFEGISRKFTQKLYEWEKAQGIGPEESTFAFLNNEYRPKITSIGKIRPKIQNEYETTSRVKLTRSKSVDSLVQNVGSLPSLLMTHQPSSLSLNDVEELETKCFVESNLSSLQNLNDTEEFLNFDEPEAVIVEVEDVVEETAAPLLSFPVFEEKHPVYLYEHQEEATIMHKSTKSEAPVVRRSESVRAQASYNLIQECLESVSQLSTNEEKIRLIENNLATAERMEKEDQPLSLTETEQVNQQNETKLDILYKEQSDLSNNLISKVRYLQEANAAVTSPSQKDDASFTVSHMFDVVELIQDLSSELVTLSEKMHLRVMVRQKEGSDLREIFKTLNAKITELKRSLSYLCAASDMTAPGRRKKSTRHLRRKRSLEKPHSGKENLNQVQNVQMTSIETHYIKQQVNGSDKVEIATSSINNKNVDTVEDIDKASASSATSLGAIKRKIKPKPKEELVQNESESDEEKEMTVVIEAPKKLSKHKKLLKTRRISDTYVKYNDSNDNESPKLLDDLKYFVIPTSRTYVEYPDSHGEISADSTATIFVKTTKKLFGPIGEDDVNEVTVEKECNDVDKERATNRNMKSVDVYPRSISLQNSPSVSRRYTEDEEYRRARLQESLKDLRQKVENPIQSPIIARRASCLPPLPRSPTPQRKDKPTPKEISPNIRIMLARYNQKLSGQEAVANKSGGSSGSASPIAWRSPVAERRVRAQTERYEEEINKGQVLTKFSPLLGGRREVQKSASVGVISMGNKQMTVPHLIGNVSPKNETPGGSPKMIRGILKSSSADVIKGPPSKIPVAKPTNTKPEVTSVPIPIPMTPTVEPEVLATSPTSQIRAYKIKQAKEAFLKDTLDGAIPSTSHSQGEQSEDSLKYPTRSRLSQISVGSESSFESSPPAEGLLVKSASAGMINVDQTTYKQFDPELGRDGYVSLPRTAKSSKFGLSSITSKFRKIKMRRSKDSSKMNTVSTLCRQSLVVDINCGSKESLRNESTEGQVSRNSSTVSFDNHLSSSEDATSSVSSRTGWIRKTNKIFKPK